MADDKLAEAVDIVARHLIYAVLDHASEEWENYPEIDENDWMAIEGRALNLASNMSPTTEEFGAAYDYLERRAEHE